MAKAFKNLKAPGIGLYDKLTFGKLANCRVVDVIEDHWEYLIWLSKNTSITFSKEVLDKLTTLFMQEEETLHVEQEQNPYLYEEVFEDVPF